MLPASSPPATVLDLIGRYQKLVEERGALLSQRRDFISQFKRTGVKVDSELFTRVVDQLEINERMLLGLRAALQLTGGAA